MTSGLQFVQHLLASFRDVWTCQCGWFILKVNKFDSCAFVSFDKYSMWSRLLGVHTVGVDGGRRLKRCSSVSMCLCWPLGMALDNDSSEYIQYVDRQNLVHVDYLRNDVHNNGICLTCYASFPFVMITFAVTWILCYCALLSLYHITI